tara:strand:- start:2807 stop:3037 length:231 start_codon:yes stop_codon:yes gene_type:complete
MADAKTLGDYLMDGGARDKVFQYGPSDDPAKYKVVGFQVNARAQTVIEVEHTDIRKRKQSEYLPLNIHMNDLEASL